MLQFRPAAVDPASAPPLRALADTSAGFALTRVSGELDALTAPRLDLLLQSLAATGHRDLVLDLRRLRFIDGAGLDLLVRWTKRMRKKGGSFRLRHPSVYMQIMAAYFRVGHDLDIEPAELPPTVDAAEMAGGGRPLR